MLMSPPHPSLLLHSELAARLTKAQGEHARDKVALRSKAEVAQREVVAARRVADAKTAEVEELTSTMMELRSELADATHRGNVRAAELELELDTTRTRREELERSVEEYRRKLLSAKQDVQARDDELMRERKLCESRLQRSQKKMEQMQRQLRGNRDTDTLQERLTAALDQVRTLELTVQRQTEQLDTASASSSVAHRQAQGELDAVRTALKHSERSASQAQAAAKQAQQQVEQLLADNRKLHAELSDTRSDLTFLQNTGEAEIAKQVAEAELRMQASVGGASAAAVEAARARAADAQATVQRLDTERQQLNDTITQQSRQIEELHAQLHSFRDADGATQRGLAEASAVIRQLTAENKALQVRVADVTADFKAAEVAAGEHASMAAAQLAAKDGEIQKTFAMASSLNKQREELLQLVRQLTSTEEERTESVAALSAEVERLRQQHSVLQQERALLLHEREEHMETIELMARERKAHAHAVAASVAPAPAPPHRARGPTGAASSAHTKRVPRPAPGPALSQPAPGARRPMSSLSANSDATASTHGGRSSSSTSASSCEPQGGAAMPPPPPRTMSSTPKPACRPVKPQAASVAHQPRVRAPVSRPIAVTLPTNGDGDVDPPPRAVR